MLVELLLPLLVALEGAPAPALPGPYSTALAEFKNRWMAECEGEQHPPTPKLARELHQLCTCTLREASSTLTGWDGEEAANTKIHAAMAKCEAEVYPPARPKRPIRKR